MCICGAEEKYPVGQKKVAYYIRGVYTVQEHFFLKRLFKKKVENSRLKPDAIGKTQPTNYCNKILSQTGPVRLTITK